MRKTTDQEETFQVIFVCTKFYVQFILMGGRGRMCGWVQVTDEHLFSVINGPGKIDLIMARIVAHSNIVTMDLS